MNRTHHGDTFVDPYEWLRDEESPEVIAYLEAENAWTAERTAHLEGLRSEIFGEIKARTKETDLSVPDFVRHGGTAWWYYTRTFAGSDYPAFYRAPAQDRDHLPDPESEVAGESLLLDLNAVAAGHDFCALGAFAVSPNGRLLAYSVDLTGDEQYELRVRDLLTGHDLPDRVERTASGACWAGDSQIFYTVTDEAWRPYEARRHEVGTPTAEDVVVYTESDERFWMGVDESRDRRWILIGVSSKTTSEYRILPAAEPQSEPRIVTPRRDGVEYDVEAAGDRLLILHNDGAEDFALAEAPLEATSHSEWREVVPATDGLRLLGVDAYARHVVLTIRRNGLPGVAIHPRAADGSLLAGVDLEFDEPIYSVGADDDAEFDTDRIRLTFTSMVTPARVVERLLDGGEERLLKQTPILPAPGRGPFLPEDLIQERLWATAADGTRIPMSVVRRRETPLDGTAPCIIYGYGSYETSIDPAFSIYRLSILDRGFVMAVAHVRGGGEMGRRWYEEGRLGRKQNTFSDFVACAHHLIAQRYTAADRLGARGFSAGGLLMGAIANLAPETFRAIHAGVPFVDPLTSMLDPELPLTVTEWDEWGDPLHSAEAYGWLKAYSPYENVAAKPYPAILATTSLHDTRVLYVEPAKWIAALRSQADNPPDRPILLRTEMSAGHGGVSGRYGSWHEEAFELAWLIDQLTSG